MSEIKSGLAGTMDEIVKVGAFHEPAGEPVRYRDNAVDGFRNGALLDLRVRFAMEMLTHSPIFEGFDSSRMAAPPDARAHAEFALDIAIELFALAESRGLIDPLPPEGEISKELRAQANRSARFQAVVSIDHQKALREEQGGIMPVAPGFQGRAN